MTHIARPGERPFKVLLVEHLNKLFGKGPDALNEFWTEVLMPELVTKFSGLTLMRGSTKEERQAKLKELMCEPLLVKLEREHAFEAAKAQISMLALFHRINKMLGLHWETNLEQEFEV